MTLTPELQLIADMEDGAIVSAGTHVHNLQRLDAIIGRQRLDLEENGVLCGCELTISGGTAVAIGTGVIWYHGSRFETAAAIVDDDDGLTDGTCLIFFGAEFYAITGAPSDPTYDVCVGTALVVAGSVESVSDAPRLLKQSDLRAFPGRTGGIGTFDRIYLPDAAPLSGEALRIGHPLSCQVLDSVAIAANMGASWLGELIHLEVDGSDAFVVGMDGAIQTPSVPADAIRDQIPQSKVDFTAATRRLALSLRDFARRDSNGWTALDPATGSAMGFYWSISAGTANDCGATLVFPVPRDWDGASDLELCLLGAPAGSEGSGKQYHFHWGYRAEEDGDYVDDYLPSLDGSLTASAPSAVGRRLTLGPFTIPGDHIYSADRHLRVEIKRINTETANDSAAYGLNVFGAYIEYGGTTVEK